MFAFQIAKQKKKKIKEFRRETNEIELHRDEKKIENEKERERKVEERSPRFSEIDL